MGGQINENGPRRKRLTNHAALGTEPAVLRVGEEEVPSFAHARGREEILRRVPDQACGDRVDRTTNELNDEKS